jgi:hypothetical protein
MDIFTQSASKTGHFRGYLYATSPKIKIKLKLQQQIQTSSSNKKSEQVAGINTTRIIFNCNNRCTVLVSVTVFPVKADIVISRYKR